MAKLSVVINAQNVEKDLPKAIASIKNLADEIVVIDQGSTDKTAEIAKKLGAKVFDHPQVLYVELARNFAISKVVGDWTLVLDPDEEIPPALGRKVKEIIKNPQADYYRIPRKNIIFGKWIEHSRWWPDYNIRLFRKGNVVWSEEIHKVPITKGKGSDFEKKEDLAIIHRNYKTIDDYLEKMFRYTKVQANELSKDGYKFDWTDLVKKPFGEFLSRFFAGEGYKDGVHGLVLAILQGFSEFVVYLRVWGDMGYKEKEIGNKEIKSVMENATRELQWWIRKEFSWLKGLKFR